MKNNLMGCGLAVALVSIALLTSVNGYGSSLSKKVMIESLDQLNISCVPGFASNGHNFPIASSLSLFNLDLIFADTNVRRIDGNDPKLRMGNHCAELTAEVAAALPAELKLTQIRSKGFQYFNGVCARFASEELDATLGAMSMMGQEIFVLETVSADHCH
jgi:hypothetical protein